MAKLIEFCGVPGANTATVYQALRNRWKESFDWMPAHKAYPRRKVAHPLKKLTSFFLDDKNLYDEKAMRKAASRFIEYYPAYIDKCWNHIANEEKINTTKADQRFEKASHLFKTIQQIQTCRESLAAKMIIIEEGLMGSIETALSRYVGEQAIEAEIENLYNCMPLPNGLIFFDVDSETISEQDKEQTNSSSGFTKEIRNLRKTAAELFERRDLPVLYLDATDTVARNTERALGFLNVFDRNMPVQKTHVPT